MAIRPNKKMNGFETWFYAEACGLVDMQQELRPLKLELDGDTCRLSAERLVTVPHYKTFLQTMLIEKKDSGENRKVQENVVTVWPDKNGDFSLSFRATTVKDAFFRAIHALNRCGTLHLV